MKKIFSLLLAVVCLLAAFSACAETPEEDFSMPVNQPAEDVEDEGGAGTVLFADGSVETDGEALTVEGYVPENMDKIVIGTDDRITVNSPGDYPFSTIAYMEVTAKCGHNWVCTGFMVGKNCLMTAAHCMVCHRCGEWAKNVTFYFGFKNKSNYVSRYTGRWTARAGTDFPNLRYDSEAEHNDWCYVIFDSNVGERTGWLGFRTASDSELSSRTYMVAGYRDYKLKYCWGTVNPKDSEIITYTADDEPGNSGGPIFTSDNYADAIIVAESKEKQLNFGRRITSFIWSWMQKDGYQ